MIRLWDWNPRLVNRGTMVALIDNVHSDMARFGDDDGDDDDGNGHDDKWCSIKMPLWEIKKIHY